MTQHVGSKYRYGCPNEVLFQVTSLIDDGEEENQKTLPKRPLFEDATWWLGLPFSTHIQDHSGLLTHTSPSILPQKRSSRSHIRCTLTILGFGPVMS